MEFPKRSFELYFKAIIEEETEAVAFGSSVLKACCQNGTYFELSLKQTADTDEIMTEA